MKLLFYRYGSIIEPDVIDGFRELGFTVLEETTEITNKTLTPQQGIKNVGQFLNQHPVEFVFSINFYPFLSEVCRIYRLPYLCWTVDSPVMELFSSSIRNETNRIFLFDRATYEELSPYNPDCIFHLPLAVNAKERDKVIRAASPKQREKFSHPLAFVGSLYTEKNPYQRLKAKDTYLEGYLNAIQEAQLKVYGYYFIEQTLTEEITKDFIRHFDGFYRLPGENFLTDRYTLANLYIGSNISVMERDRICRLLSPKYPFYLYTGSDTKAYPQLHNCGLAKSLTEMPVIFHESKINLNITSKPIRSALPLRIWDILSAGGFCLTNYQSELNDELVIGEHLACYTSLEELDSLVAYYLEHENERREIAECGCEYVKTHCTYPLRLTKMLELAFHL